MNGLEVAATLVSIGSAVFAVFAWFAAHRQARAADASARRAREEAASIAREANALTALRWSTEHFEGLRAWAAHATQAMCEAQELLAEYEDDVDAEYRQRLRATLSAALDTGRWYFPNAYEEKYGRENPPAYRGVRVPVLECLYEAYKALDTQSPDRAAHSRLINAKRTFVSYIQSELDPRRVNERLEAVKARYAAVDRMRDDGG